MKYYFVYFPMNVGVMEKVLKIYDYNILASYYFLRVFFPNFLKKKKFLLDSGAFSANATNKPIELREYIKFIKRNKKYIENYFNLDDIKNPERTYQNQKIMEEEGLNPIPVFHIKEDFKWLKKYIKEGYNYIALGGMVPFAKRKNLLRLWLYKCFSIIPKRVRVHGFGITNANLLIKFPFYSVDSSSWVVGGRFGDFYIYERGKIKQKNIKIKNNTITNEKLHKHNLIQWIKYSKYLEEISNYDN